jgi:hypothetical protein
MSDTFMVAHNGSVNKSEISADSVVARAAPQPTPAISPAMAAMRTKGNHVCIFPFVPGLVSL